MSHALRNSTVRHWRAHSLTAALVLCGLPFAHAGTSPPAPAGGSTWTVNGIGEPATLASAACNTTTHICPTLRDAINTALSGDTIVFAPALDHTTINLTLYSNLMGCTTSNATTCSDGGTLGREFGPSAFFIDGRSLTIDATALITGVTIARSSASGTANFRLFDVAPGSGLTLRGLVLQGGIAKGGNSTYGGGALGAGGAIFNQGNLDVDRCTMVDNTATGGSAGTGGFGYQGGGVGADSVVGGGVGGGPNGGSSPDGSPTAAGFGGGGGGPSWEVAGSAGGFGGGGGGGGTGGAGDSSSYQNGGSGGFGGGGGSGFLAPAVGGVAGFGGGNGDSSTSGAGAGMGGAIFNDAGTLSIRNSHFVGNRATGGSASGGGSGGGSAFGGAIFNYNGALTLDFTTLVDNSVLQGTGVVAGNLGGSAIYSLGDSLAACSAGGNTCTTSGATLTMNLSVAARSLGSPKDVTLDAIHGGTSTASGRGNFIANKQALNGTSLGDLVTVNMAGITDPMLATTLAANSGFGLTLMPQPGSPLIDPVTDAVCTVAIDQRGIARPQGAACDVGAVEVRGPAVTVAVATHGSVSQGSSTQSLGSSTITNCRSDSAPYYCSTRISSEAGAPDVLLVYMPDDGYRLDSMTSTCGATLDANLPQIHITALAADCSVNVAFAPNTISGSVSGLAGSGLVLHLDYGNGEDLTIAAGASTFAFATPVGTGAPWTITATQPTNPPQTCTVTPDTGTMPAGNVSDIVVACTTNAYTIGGNASGIDATGLVLQLNGGSDLPVNTDGPFTFATSVDSGAPYAVTILSQPAGRSCTLGNASGNVGTGNVTNVSVACLAVPQLVLSLSDARDFARYGQVVDTITTLTNNGDGEAADVAVTFTLSAGFDGDYAQLTCYGAGGGATCTQDTGNPLLYHVALPAHRSLTWLVSVPVRADAPGATVDFSVSADGAATVTDTDTLVLFRDGFDVPYGDGTQAVPVVEGAAARAILDGDDLREVSVPDAAVTPGATTTLLIVRDDARDLRVDWRNVFGLDLVRLLARDADGRERASPWSLAQKGATLELGSEAAGDAAEQGAASRDVVLVGADTPLAIRSEDGATQP